MLQAAMKVVEYMDGLGLSTEERLRLLGSVSRLNANAFGIKNMLDAEGLSHEEQMQVVRVIRTMLRPRKAKGKAKNKAKA